MTGVFQSFAVVPLAGLALFAVAEAIARMIKLADYPLFAKSGTVGYRFLPNTRGSMLGRYRWRMNAMGLRIDHDRPPEAASIVLLGDSTVEDGVYVDQDATLAARLAAATGRDVYPVACPAWSLENQLAFLREHPDLYDAGTMVFVTNTQDLAALNRWETECAQPTRRPRSHAWYKLMRATHLPRRIAFPFLFPPWADETDRTWEISVRDFLDRFRGRIVWLFYPLREEALGSLVPCQELCPLIEDRAETFDLGMIPGWSMECYQDEIHPTARGRTLLLEAIQAALARPLDRS